MSDSKTVPPMTIVSTAVASPVTQQSTASKLRQFRIKNASLSGSDAARKELVPGKKRIQVMSPDSDSDETGPSQKKPKAELTVKEKEARFKALDKLAPEYDTMDIQDALVRNDWNNELANKYLLEKCTPKRRAGIYPATPTTQKSDTPNATATTRPLASQVQRTMANGSGGGGGGVAPRSSGHTSKGRAKSGAYSDGDDSDEVVRQAADQVYDSDESDTEVSYQMNGQRKKVFDFINTASLLELQTVKTLSEKKASVLMELRPFSNWKDLCDKVENNKQLSGDLLNNAQELINKQTNVANILEKCNKMVKRVEAAIKTGAGIVEQPELLNDSLKLADYQMIGLNWLAVMHNQKMNGILADEMGLGKTIQVIAFLAYLKENGLAKGAHLVVVPSSTLDNWVAEIARWCPTLKVEKYHASQDERRRMRLRYAKVGFTDFDIMLTTYHVVAASPEERKMFRVCKLHYVIFDEAHLLKNMTTQRYANLITINAEMRILLTGTPLQNNLLELMSLLCFVMPKFFKNAIEDIKSLFAKKAKVENGNDEGSQFQESQVDRAKSIMKPFVLRRLKNDVLSNLPAKHSYVEKVPMLDRQKQHYNELVEYYAQHKSAMFGDNAGINIMTQMRKIANHPLLMRYYFSDERLQEFAERLASVSTYKKTNVQYIFEELAVKSDFQIWQLCRKHEFYDVTIPDKLICESGKFAYLDKLLPQLKTDGHRVLIFSQFTMVLDIMEQYLKIRKFGYFRLDGSTAVDDRHDMINDFNADAGIFIFLLSTKAGGVGINLTAADTCIIHDIDFNPYNDKQAEDRCHRMGQKRPVSIYRLIAEASIEEGMQMVAEQKLKLEQDITTEKGSVLEEQKCVVSLLTMALRLDKEQQEQLNKSINGSLTVESSVD